VSQPGLGVSTTRRSSCRPTKPWEQAGSIRSRRRRAAHVEQGMRIYIRNSTMPWRFATGIMTLE